MSKTDRDSLIADMVAAHDEFLLVVSDYQSPDERRPVIAKSMTEFPKFLEQATSGKLSVEEIQKIAEIIRSSAASAKYPKGTCDLPCMESLIRTHSVLVALVAQQKLPDPVKVGICDMSSRMVEGIVSEMLLSANGDQKPWQIKEKIHKVTTETIQAINNLITIVKEGRVLTLKMPDPAINTSPDKGKSFVN